MPFLQEEALQTLMYVSTMSLQGSLVKRYLVNPHVTRKDSVHEHIARITRLATVILPVLRAEFAEQPETLAELNHLQTLVSIHDDEEILDKMDIATFAKQHDADNAREIALVTANLANLTPAERDYLVKYFSTFRKRKELTGPMRMLADIAKVLDNLVGNQLAIEDEAGLIQPDYAISCLNYVRDYEGKVCQTIDALIQAQLKQMMDLRARIKTDGTVERLATQWATEQKGSYEHLVERICKQLAIELSSHSFNKDRSYIPVWEYDVTTSKPSA